MPKSRTRGHVRRRGNKWVIVYDAGEFPAHRCLSCGARTWLTATERAKTCPKCGGELGPQIMERRQRWASGFRTRAEANAELTRILSEGDRGEDPFPEEITFAEFSARWLENEKARIRPSTYRRYRGLLQRDILPKIGSVRLDKLRPSSIREVMGEMSKRGLSPASVNQARAVMGSALRQAMEDDLIQTNPVRAVRPPKARHPELAVPTATQLATLMAVARGSAYEIPILLACATGARRSEILGLRWSDFDATRGVIRIVRGLQRVPGPDGRELRVVDPKTSRARREFKLPTFAIERLKQLRRDQARRQWSLGAGWFRDEALGELICERGDGGPIDPDNFTAAFKRHAKTAGFDPRTRLHDVRHAVATKLAEDGVPLVAVSALLGHSSAGFTASVYQHAFTTMTDRAAEALDAAFGS